jgi:hypothetical protein
MGATAPSLMTMSIAPFEAQKRALNLGAAESAAVTYSAINEGKYQLVGSVPDICERAEIGYLAYEIECTEGEGTKYKQTVTRAFRLRDPSCDDNDGNNGHGNSGGNDCSNPGNGNGNRNGNGNGNSGRTFAYEPPASFSIWPCPPEDPFGVEGFNKRFGVWCRPTPLTHWGDSHPIPESQWKYDLSAWWTGEPTGPNG